MKRDKTEFKAQGADNGTFYPQDVYLPDGKWMTISDRETHLKALRAWGCQSEIFTATTREEAERIADAELREIAALSERGVELIKSWVRFLPAMNHYEGQERGFFYATLSAAGIGGNFPSGGTKLLRERLVDAMKCAGFLKEEITRMLTDPKECGYCTECIQKTKARMKCSDGTSNVEDVANTKKVGFVSKGGRPRKRADTDGGGCTQEEAAKICGVCASTIRRWDRNQGTPEGYPGRNHPVELTAWANRRAEGKNMKRAVRNAVSYDDRRDQPDETEDLL